MGDFLPLLCDKLSFLNTNKNESVYAVMTQSNWNDDCKLDNDMKLNVSEITKGYDLFGWLKPYIYFVCIHVGLLAPSKYLSSINNYMEHRGGRPRAQIRPTTLNTDQEA